MGSGKTHWPRTGAVGPFAMGCDHTPEPPRATKKRRIEVTPQPDYQTMDTPILQVNHGADGGPSDEDMFVDE